MAKSIQLKFAIGLSWFFAMLSTSMVVYAAENDRLAHGLEAIPFGDVKYCLIIIGIAGLLATLMKMTNVNTPPVRDMTLEICKDAVGSLAAGLLGYLTISWVDQEIYRINILMQAVFIFFSAFGGSRLIEPMYNDGFLGIVRTFISRLLGRQAAPPGDPKP